ncbi:hypothetical protein HK405_001539, partial [Cladochytrium tenue]
FPHGRPHSPALSPVPPSPQRPATHRAVPLQLQRANSHSDRTTPHGHAPQIVGRAVPSGLTDRLRRSIERPIIGARSRVPYSSDGLLSSSLPSFGLYSASPSRRHWKPDELALGCDQCGARFGLINRRHHCRMCGGVFCGLCAYQFITLGRDARPSEDGVSSRCCIRCVDSVLTLPSGQLVADGTAVSKAPLPTPAHSDRTSTADATISDAAPVSSSASESVPQAIAASGASASRTALFESPTSVNIPSVASATPPESDDFKLGQSIPNNWTWSTF